MQEELLQFKLQEVWTLVELPNRKGVIRTKWVFRNKKDERGIVIKNKMDVKSAFLYGKIKDEVYVCQPLGFEDSHFPNRVYKVEKALMDCIKLLELVYVDDIIFRSIRKNMCIEFEKMMHKKFQVSSMGVRTFFLGLKVKQKEDGIFISQDKYVNEMLNKFGFSDVKTARTPMETQKALLKDADGEDVDEHLYRSMIGSLMYLTSSRPDIMFVVCACERFQVNPKVSHLHAVKSDYAGASLDRKFTIGGCQFLCEEPCFHSKTKHIEIWHHFIRVSNKKKLIKMIKIHTDQNVVDLLTKAFDVSRFQYLIASIGMLNL
ncbi:putative ribonuclease H-like domain-containing protein [Tanacetum coccineum]